MRKMTLEIMIMMEDEALKNAIEYVKNNDILIKFGKVTPENINKFIDDNDLDGLFDEFNRNKYNNSIINYASQYAMDKKNID